MQRPITGFACDESGDWTALLSCGHRQHVRHDPPFVTRPWTVTAAGRASRLGEQLDCVRCDRLELPDACVAFERTPEFTEDSISERPTRTPRDRSGSLGPDRRDRGRAAIPMCRARH